MSKWAEPGVAALVIIALATPAFAEGYGLGRPATDAEIAAWDIDIRPDGQGLPEGQGTPLEGEEIYAEQCAVCHGDFGEGVDRWPILVGGFDTLTEDRPVKTIGSYWPFASTVWDYVHRAMPFGEAQSLSDDEVYAIVAYLLYMNDIIEDEEAVLSRETFADVEMPNADGFIPDDRPDMATLQQGEPCMRDCTDAPLKVIMRARVLDVTPEGE
jgi:cytochrome c